MWNVWSTMEELVDTVTTNRTHNRESILFGMGFNDFTKITIADTRLDYVDKKRECVSVRHSPPIPPLPILPSAMAFSRHSLAVFTKS